MSQSAPHPVHSQLADLVESRLPPEERDVVAAHVTSCPECTQEVAWLERTIDLMRSDASIDPPSHVLSRALRLFQTRPNALGEPPPAGVLGLLRQSLRAVLQSDSGERPLAFGLRTGVTAGARQLVYAAGDYAIEIRATPADRSWMLAGQVLGFDPGPGAAATVKVEGPAVRAETTLNEMQEFAFAPLPAGVYALRLRLPVADVEIAELTLPLV
ncbi:MAG: zf-HC2 domain-containing protein [Chloroflexota bacterium]|nr:zf-HC2 domain-containing protein [Chloroflexota bacterium]